MVRQAHHSVSVAYVQDTIVAQATPVGEGAIGIIRLSGPDSVKILANIFRGKTQPADFETHKLYLGKIVDYPFSPSPLMSKQETSARRQKANCALFPDARSATELAEGKGEGGEQVIDQVMAVWMKAPQTFTGEEMVEIHSHGGIFVMTKILETVQRCGARVAEPGEFSKRAFLNSKIDLAQAEAIADLISAKSEWAAQNSLRQLDGHLSRLIGGLREKIISLLARIELGFDFVEEDVQLFDRGEVVTLLTEIQGEISSLLDTFETGKLYREGLKVALVGRPNVGKSSLLNAILSEDRAIIHEEPGTTRDVIEGERRIGGIVTRFYDTAGLREALHPVEKEGIRRSEEVFEKADLVCLILDSSSPLTPEDSLLLQKMDERKTVVVCNKSDLPPEWEPGEEIRSRFRSLKVSAKFRKGIDTLLQTLLDVSTGSKLVKDHSQGRPTCLNGMSQAAAAVSYPSHRLDHNYVLNNVRHKGQIEKVHACLTTLLKDLETDSLSEECLAEELRIIVGLLDEVTGKITSDDVLTGIFSKFCIGK